MIMAGGKGSRLGPLTCHRSKPAVPFGGRYRIIDFVLSNFVNSGYRRIYVLTQYMATSLIKYLNRNWRLSGLDEFIEIVPAQMRVGDSWYRGTADAVFQNLNLLRDDRTEHVAVFGGDHIYKFAIDQMEASHRERNADLTVATFPVPRHEAHQFGICHVDADGRITGFVEKPHDPPEIPGRPGWCLVSMGNYIFRHETLMNVLSRDADDPDTSHDFGRNIIPRLVEQGSQVYAYDFAANEVPGEPSSLAPYWRDVGTIDSYFQTNMDVRERLPPINMYNRGWRMRTAQRDYPPARFVREGEHGPSSRDRRQSGVRGLNHLEFRAARGRHWLRLLHSPQQLPGTLGLALRLRCRRRLQAAERTLRQELQGCAQYDHRLRCRAGSKALPLHQ